MISLQQLQERGGFVDTTPVSKEISWLDNEGEEVRGTVFVVRQPWGVVEQALMSSDKGRSHTADLLSKCIRLGAEGKEQMTYEQAYGLTPAVALAMTTAINEVNSPRTHAR